MENYMADIKHGTLMVVYLQLATTDLTNERDYMRVGILTAG
jgi:hypothetical protein